MSDSPNKSERVLQLLKTGMAAKDIAKQVGCTTGLVYNIKSSMGISTPRRAKGSPTSKAKTKKMSTTANASGDIGLSGLLEAVRRTEKDKAAMRTALERMAQIVGEALG